MQNDELKPFLVGYEGAEVIFYMRMISLQEEDTITQRFADIADLPAEAKFPKMFEIRRDCLAEFSVKMPETAGEKPKPLGKGEIRDALKAHFEYNPRNERVIADAFILFQAQLRPNSRFL